MKPSSSKKILVIAESIDVEDSSASKGRVALIKNLFKAGFELQVYHYTRKNIQLENIPCFAIKENRRSLLFFLSRSERYLRKYFKQNPNKYIEQLFGFSFTFFNDSNSITAALRKINIDSVDLVITLSKGASFRPHHALLKMPIEWQRKWMAYVHDPYPFAYYPRPYDWVEPGHEQKRKFFVQVSKKATYIAYPSLLLAEWMENYFPFLRGKQIIIPHQISEVDLSNTELPIYFDPEKFNILHAGNLLWGRDPMGLIEGFKKFLEKTPEAKKSARLILLGNRNHYTIKLNNLKEKISQLYVSEGYVSHTAVLNMQENASVNVILEAKSEISPFLPGKFPHLVRANKPILLLGPYFSESRRLLRDNYHYCAEIDEVEKIADLIRSLYFDFLAKSHTKLDLLDLSEYLSEKYLYKTIEQIDKI